ncbi:MAG: AmmeMemoRadiSam system protein B [Verrucomicrobiota bacterium]|nr:AmmeMemoRadiSam system protein B [Verrucomicrobiota bacterium]
MESTLAGAWYPADADTLRREVNGYLAASAVEPDPSVFAVVVPHAGYAYSGPVAAVGINALAAAPRLRRVVVLGFSHRIRLPNRASIPSTETHYRSPLGETPLDTEVLSRWMDHPLFTDMADTRQGENSVELPLPLLQAALAGREWTLLPITLGQMDERSRRRVAEEIAAVLDDETGLVVSSDFTHYGPDYDYVPFQTDVAENLDRLDHGAMDFILAGDEAGFEAYCTQTGATICGSDAIGVLLHLLASSFTARELAYETSVARTGDERNSVSYASLGFYRKQAPVRLPANSPRKPVLTRADQTALLALARQSIEDALQGRRRSFVGSVSPGMKCIMGGFVTLSMDGELRGCIGEIMPRRPLVEVVAERALDAAFEDPRFPPLTPGEWPVVKIEISALTPPEPVASWREIEIGRHGMSVELNGRSAVFLPQVATEQGWTLEETLTHLAVKAGLHAAAWRDPAARYEVFEAVVFHE